jgi:hypothetical protein
LNNWIGSKGELTMSSTEPAHQNHEHQPHHHHEPEPRRHEEYLVDIEGKIHPWPKDTITTEEIIALGGWPPAEGAIEIFKDNTERTLKPGEVVHIKPGHGFAKRVLFKRG